MIFMWHNTHGLWCTVTKPLFAEVTEPLQVFLKPNNLTSALNVYTETHYNISKKQIYRKTPRGYFRESIQKSLQIFYSLLTFNWNPDCLTMDDIFTRSSQQRFTMLSSELWRLFFKISLHVQWKSRSIEIGCYNQRIALKFDRHHTEYRPCSGSGNGLAQKRR